VVGALVIMAASSVAAGFVIGRMTAGPTAASVSTRVEGVASGDNSTRQRLLQACRLRSSQSGTRP